jgi:hypothetical protein
LASTADNAEPAATCEKVLLPPMIWPRLRAEDRADLLAADGDCRIFDLANRLADRVAVGVEVAPGGGGASETRGSGIARSFAPTFGGGAVTQMQGTQIFLLMTNILVCF